MKRYENRIHAKMGNTYIVQCENSFLLHCSWFLIKSQSITRKRETNETKSMNKINRKKAYIYLKSKKKQETKREPYLARKGKSSDIRSQMKFKKTENEQSQRKKSNREYTGIIGKEIWNNVILSFFVKFQNGEICTQNCTCNVHFKSYDSNHEGLIES